MKLLVAVKQVAALDEDFEIRADGKDVDRTFWFATSTSGMTTRSRRQCGSRRPPASLWRSSRLCIGPEDADEVLRKCLAKGADRALRVWDEAIEGSDSIRHRALIAAVARRARRPDMLFAGVQSSDQAFASTGIATAALLDWPHAAVVTKLEYVSRAPQRCDPSRAGGRSVARNADRLPGGVDHSTGYQRAALCFPARDQTGRGQADRSAVARAARRARRLGGSERLIVTSAAHVHAREEDARR
jgi:hypothetical protein